MKHKIINRRSNITYSCIVYTLQYVDYVHRWGIYNIYILYIGVLYAIVLSSDIVRLTYILYMYIICCSHSLNLFFREMVNFSMVSQLWCGHLLLVKQNFFMHIVIIYYFLSNVPKYYSRYRYMTNLPTVYLFILYLIPYLHNVIHIYLFKVIEVKKLSFTYR